jgi:hypothetical protein
VKTEKIIAAMLLYTCLIFVPTSLTWPDGGYVSVKLVTESVAISADQRAILIKKGNEISMAFSTGYTGEGEDFGWIIPTPVPPAIEDVCETGDVGETAFRILDEYTAPRITFLRETYVHSSCFPAGTEVLTADGPRAIEDIEPGTKISSHDLQSEEWTLAEVIVQRVHQYEGEMITIHLDSHQLQATGNHPFYVLTGNRLASRPLPKDLYESFEPV